MIEKKQGIAQKTICPTAVPRKHINVQSPDECFCSGVAVLATSVCPADLWVRLQAWGFLLVFYSNYSRNSHDFSYRGWDRQTDRQTDRQMHRRVGLGKNELMKKNISEIESITKSNM